MREDRALRRQTERRAAVLHARQDVPPHRFVVRLKRVEDLEDQRNLPSYSPDLCPNLGYVYSAGPGEAPVRIAQAVGLLKVNEADVT